MIERVSEWQSVWVVKLEYANIADNDGYPYREVIAETPAHLRRILEWARANPGIVSFPQRRLRRIAGDRPTECRRGHGYDGGSFTRVTIRWTDCICGGHLIYLCRHCEDAVLDPPVYQDCTTTETEAVRTARA
jgi:hypothetical protein